MKKLKVGLFGFGCVGQGLYEVLEQSSSICAQIEKICIKHPDKKRSIDSSYFTNNKNELLNNPEINVIIELIDNSDEAFEIVCEALRKGKAVITANKKMLAEHFVELYELQRETKLPILYEGSVCAAIPIIRTLEEYYDNDLLSSIEGIFNGTSNYILTKTCDEFKSYNEVLKEAQDLGFAESNPKLDVEGYDAKYKLLLVAAHAFGVFLKPEDILNIGIHHLLYHDIIYSGEKSLKIKLVPYLKKIDNQLFGYVIPQFVKENNPLYSVNNEFNAVCIQAAFSDKQFFIGKGAGSYPTGAAVLSDLSALTYDYKYEYKKFKNSNVIQWSNDTLIKAYIRFSDTKILDILRVTNITETYNSKDFCYVIGEVNVLDLIEANINSNPNVFIIKIEDLDPPIEQFNYSLSETLEVLLN